MSDLVEKVARAICDTPNNADSSELSNWNYWKPEACAAIAVVLKDLHEEFAKELMSPSMQVIDRYARENGIKL